MIIDEMRNSGGPVHFNRLCIRLEGKLARATVAKGLEFLIQAKLVKKEEMRLSGQKKHFSLTEGADLIDEYDKKLDLLESTITGMMAKRPHSKHPFQDVSMDVWNVTRSLMEDLVLSQAEEEVKVAIQSRIMRVVGKLTFDIIKRFPKPRDSGESVPFEMDGKKYNAKLHYMNFEEQVALIESHYLNGRERLALP